MNIRSCRRANGRIVRGVVAFMALTVSAAVAQKTQVGSLVEQARLRAHKLPNGWSISPLGESFETGDLVLNLLATPDGEYAIALNSGYNEHALTLFKIDTAEVVERVALPTSWMGMTFSPDGKRLYVSGGNVERGPRAPLHVFEYDAGGGVKLKRIERPVFTDDVEGGQIFWSGLAHHPTRELLYAANRTAGHIVVFDTTSGAIEAKIKTGVNPYDLIFSHDAKSLFVSNWASDTVTVIDVERNAVRRIIEVGDNPNDMVLARDGRLFVACANDNSVVVVNTRTERAVGKIVTSMWERDPEGSTPNFVLLDEDEDTLYVANADNNNLCVVDVTPGGDSRVLGFIPTAAYPSAIGLSSDGRRLIVAASKGTRSSSNLRGPKVGRRGGGRVPGDEGVAGTTKTLIRGSVHVFDVPASGAELKALTAQAYRNTPYHEDLLREARPARAASVIPNVVGAGSPIKHVIYILKENRTYDQIFGDVEKGRGDPRIAIFGREITPNHHALAEQFALLDNFYVDAEVSVDGHSWSDAAYATDFNEKTWPADYGNKVGRPPFTEAAEPPSGYIWEIARRAGLTIRSYGEKTSHPSWAGQVAPDYKGWGAELDLENAEEFIREFDEYEANYDDPDPSKRLPNFIMMSLPHDHTYGGRSGMPTVQACVAANDLALGMIVERVTRSRYWPETAIFVTEDDAQDGSDHIDCHRSILLCVSPYTKRGTVDSTHYTTSSILRTMELLLGLPPMSQFDAAATPLFNSMGVDKDLTPYKALPAEIDLTARNKDTAYGARESEAMDFDDFDRAPMFELNEIIWKLVRGPDSRMPFPVRRYDVGAVLPNGP